MLLQLFEWVCAVRVVPLVKPPFVVCIMQLVNVSKVTANVVQAVQHSRCSDHNGVVWLGLLMLLEVASNLAQHGLCVL